MSLEDPKLQDELQGARDNYLICERAFKKLVRARHWLWAGLVLSAVGASYLILVDNGLFAIPIIAMMTIASCLSIAENIAHNESDRDAVLDRLRWHRNYLEYQAYRNKQMEEGKEECTKS